MSREVVKGNFFHNTSQKFAHNFYNKYLSKDELQRPLKVSADTYPYKPQYNQRFF
jgi:hypothetical protein